METGHQQQVDGGVETPHLGSKRMSKERLDSDGAASQSQKTTMDAQTNDRRKVSVTSSVLEDTSRQFFLYTKLN